MKGSHFQSLPGLYPIVDATTLSRAGISIETFAASLSSAGIRFLQYRNKEGSDAAVLQDALIMRSIFPPGETTLILNDHAHLIAATGFDGLHIGQLDLSPGEARTIIGQERLLGLSTHNRRQLISAVEAPVDYVAIGPVFGTRTKENPDPVVGLAGVREARSLTDKPLVAIGGITTENARGIFDAGADSIALISALLSSDDLGTAKVLADFLSRIG